MEDIEIARNTKLKKIDCIAKELGLNEEEIELYGKYKAKILPNVIKRMKDKKKWKISVNDCN